MTLSIDITQDVEARLRERASKAGLDPAEFTKRIIKQVVCLPTTDDALAPFRKQVAESGMIDEQLDAFFEEMIREARVARRVGDG